MEIKIGKIYKVKEERRNACPMFHHRKGVYIKVTDIVNEYLWYEILDDNKIKIDKCSACFSDSDLIPLEEETNKEEFKVGDRVKIKPGSRFEYQSKLPGVIKHKKDSGWWTVEFQDTCRDNYQNEDLEKLPEEPNTIFDEKKAIEDIDKYILKHSYRWDHMPIEPLFEPIIKKKSFMSNIMQKLKDLTLSETDRLLREEGFEDENGKMTEQARDLMNEKAQQERWDKERESIAENIKKIKESEKK